MKVRYIDQEIEVEHDSFNWDDFDLLEVDEDFAVGTYMDQLIEIDRDMYEFLNASENNKAPHEMGDTHEYIQGGLTYDKDRSFVEFQKKMRQEEDFKGPNKTLGV